MTDRSDRSDRWSAVLDALEAHVDAAWALLADEPDETVSLEPWVPPADLGPCPAALQPRALAVLARQHELEEGLARRMEAVAREVQVAARRSQAPGTPPRSRFLDQRA